MQSQVDAPKAHSLDFAFYRVYCCNTQKEGRAALGMVSLTYPVSFGFFVDGFSANVAKIDLLAGLIFTRTKPTFRSKIIVQPS
jgi:hypothetical protein